MSKMFRNLTVIISSETNFVGGKSTKTHVCISYSYTMFHLFVKWNLICEKNTNFVAFGWNAFIR